QTFVASASGSYTVTVTASGCTSAASAATVVTVNPIPATPTITPGGPTTFCAGGSVTLSSSSASGNQWFLNGNPIGGATNQTYVATAAGSYTVTVTASGCTSASSAATVVTVNPNPNATITAPPTANSGSTGNVASVANAGVGATYNWGITNGTITAGTGTNSITFTAGAVGTLTLNITVTTSAGCSDAKSANVSVGPPTVTSVSPTGGTIAGGSSVTINGTGFNAGATVTFGGSAATNVVVVSSIKITARTPAHALGAVNVTVTNTNSSTGTLTNGYLYKAQQFDPNNDGTITSSDIFYLVNFLFLGGPPPSGAAGMLSGDANGDGAVNSADIFYLVNYLFLGGPRPNAPTSSLMTTSTEGTATPEIAGSITLGEPVLRSGRYVVPVVMTTRAGSIVPQAMSLRLHFDREVGNVTIGKAGAAKDLAAPFEITRRSGNDVSYLISYGGLALGESHSAVVAEIGIDSVGGAVAISVDPQLTMLSDQAGLTSATVENGKLEVNGTAIRNVEPRPHIPDNKVN
ncbi:MAG TPA: IPT/TIG domain-containing protein, partial [Thermoanaerobaculia bacterium]